MRTDHREGTGAKARKIIYSKGGSARTRMVDTSGRERQSFVLDDAEIIQLGRLARAGRGALRPSDGYGMGQGRSDRRAVEGPARKPSSPARASADHTRWPQPNF